MHGRWAGTPLAEAHRAWSKVHYERTAAEANSRTAPLLRRPGFARAADAARREVPLEAAYKELQAAERARLVPEVQQATDAVELIRAASSATRCTPSTCSPRSPSD